MPLDTIPQFTKIPYGEKIVHNDLFNCDIYADNVVEKTPLFGNIGASFGVEHYDKLNNYYGLLNPKSQKILQCSPVSETYQLVNHADLFHKQALLIKDSELPTENITVIDYLYEEGRRAKREIYFNDLVFKVDGNKDNVKCRLDVFNSVDQSWQFQVFSGAYRSLCRNTCVFGGEKAYHQKVRHTKNIDPQAMLGKATYSLKSWQDNKDLMKAWRNIRLSNSQYVKLLSNSELCTVVNSKAEKFKSGLERKVNKSLADYLCQIYEKEDASGTLWGAYNSFTHWATHTNEKYLNSDGHQKSTGTKDGKMHTVQAKRNELVRTLLESNDWKELENAE